MTTTEFDRTTSFKTPASQAQIDYAKSLIAGNVEAFAECLRINGYREGGTFECDLTVQLVKFLGDIDWSVSRSSGALSGLIGDLKRGVSIGTLINIVAWLSLIGPSRVLNTGLSVAERIAAMHAAGLGEVAENEYA